MTKKISFADILFSVAPFTVKLFKAFDHVIAGAVACVLPPLSKKDIPLNIKNILIIRPGGIGDAVFILPILQALKKRGLVVDILCEKRNGEIFSSQTELFNKIYLYDRNPFAVFANSYDAVIDTEQWHYLSAITAYFIRSSYKIGFATRPKRTKLFHKAVPYGDNDYELDNFSKLFKNLLNPEDIKGLAGSFKIDLPIQAWAKEQLPDKSVSVFLGASIILRRLNEEQVMNIVSGCLEKGSSIALLGGKDVADFAHKITAKINSPQISNFTGKLSLVQSAALIQRSSLFIGPDSGLMHLACALDVPVVGVFGPGNLAKWGPKGQRDKIITENAICSPCTKFGYTVPTCKGSYHCVKNLNFLSIKI